MRKLLISAFFLVTLTSMYFTASAQITLETIMEDIQYFIKSPVDDRLLIITEENIFIWNPVTRETLITLGDMGSSAFRLRWSPQGTYIVVATIDGGYVWDANTGDLLHILDGHPVNALNDSADISGVAEITISPDENLAVTMHYYDSALLVWDLSTGEMIQSLNWDALAEEEASYSFTPRQVGLSVIEFSPDGRILASAGLVNTILLWDMSTWEQIGQVEGNLFEFSPDSRLIATTYAELLSTAVESEIWIYDIQTLDLTGEYSAFHYNLEMAWTANSQIIIGKFNSTFGSPATDYAQQAMYSWNVTTNELYHVFARVRQQEIAIELEENVIIESFIVNQDDIIRISVVSVETEDILERIDITPDLTDPMVTYDLSSDDLRDFSLSFNNQFLTTLHRSTNSSEDIISWLVIWNFETGEEIYEIPMTDFGLEYVEWLSDNQTIVFQYQAGREYDDPRILASIDLSEILD